jgi:hypothetical protein
MSAMGGSCTLARVALTPMSALPPLKLSALRDIGWEEWDPIRLNGSEGGWRRSEAADEYDRYMLRVVDGLRNGECGEPLIDYLVAIETRHMGLTETPATRTRAWATWRPLFGSCTVPTDAQVCRIQARPFPRRPEQLFHAKLAAAFEEPPLGQRHDARVK